MKVEISRAALTDAARLTAIAHDAKRVGGYSEEYLDLWSDELTIAPDFIERNPVYCARLGNEIVGFYALAPLEDCFELEHLWVIRSHHRQGIGTRLLRHAMRTVQTMGMARLPIVADPHAVAFYRRLGARPTGTVPSRPAGRELPVLVIDL